MRVIRTARLEGRPAGRRDARFAAELLARPEVGAWAGLASPGGRREASALASGFAAHWQAHGFGLRVWEARGRPTALAGLKFCVIEGRGAVEAAFAVAPERWGEGIGREAMSAVMAEEAPGVCAEVQAVVREGNEPAVRLLRGLGFRETAAQPGAGRRRFTIQVKGL
jgi:RimJ/RimL family protein N-acetyltransferase